MDKFEAIIFDLGGVLINLDYQLTIDAFKKLGGTEFDLTYSQAAQNSVFDDYETGKISTQHFINKLKDSLPASITPNQIVAAWNAMILNFPLEKIALLEKLSNQKRIFLLSNTNDIHIQKVAREFTKVSDKKLNDYFEKVYLSHEIHQRKPYQETFEFVCKDAGIDPLKTLFIDDSEQHILGAQQIGLSTLHLTPDKNLLAYFE